MDQSENPTQIEKTTHAGVDEAVPSTPRRHFSKPHILVLAFLLLAATAFLVNFAQNFSNKNDKLGSTTRLAMPQAPTTCQASPTSQKDFEFVSEQSITDEGVIASIRSFFNEQEINAAKYNISEPVREIIPLALRNQVLYLTGFEEPAKHNGELSEVKLLDLNTQSTKTLYSYKIVYTPPTPNSKVFVPDVSLIRSISVNEKQNLVAIVTDKQLLLYNLDLHSIVFEHDGKTVTGDEVYDKEHNRHFFQVLSFSPNDQYGLLTYGYYEGIGYYLLDFQNKKISSLDKGGYGGGEFIEGWLDNELVYRDIDAGKDAKNNYCFESVSGKNPRCIPLTVNIEQEFTATNSANIFVIASLTDLNAKQKACNNIDQAYEYSPHYDTIVKLSFKDMSEKVLLRKDTTNVSGFTLNSRVLGLHPYNLSGVEGLLVKLRLEDKSEIFAFLNPEEPEKLTKLVFTERQSDVQ